jgi:carbon storage regulator
MHRMNTEGFTMLVVTRRPEEAVLISGDIRVVVLGIVGNRVRLGISAPDSVRVFREELLDSTQAERTMDAFTVIEAELSQAMDRAVSADTH